MLVGNVSNWDASTIATVDISTAASMTDVIAAGPAAAVVVNDARVIAATNVNAYAYWYLC